MPTDFSARELKDAEAAENRRVSTKDWTASSVWHSLEFAKLLEPLTRQLEQERHGRLFRTVAEEFLERKVVGVSQRERASAKWELVKPLLTNVHVANVDHRLLSRCRQSHALTFVNDVLRYARQQQHDRNPNNIPTLAHFPTPDKLETKWLGWINKKIKPTGFVTVLMPHATLDDEQRFARVPRSPLFYVSLVTKRAEHMLWGKKTMHVRKQKDRCLWIGVHEIDEQVRVERERFLHFHLLLRMPTRPMRMEREKGLLTPDGRRAAMQDALIEATKLTPEAFTTGSQLRPRADIQVVPYETRHAKYVFDKLKAAGEFHDLNPTTLHAAGLVVLPNALRPADRTAP